MKKRLLPITILASLGVAALAGCGGGSGGGGGGGSTVDVTGVTLNKTSLELYPEGSEKLVATVAPADATDKSVTWKSGDSRICTVDAEGLVTAVAVGTAKVTVTTVDGGYKAECNVTVKLNMNSITISNKAEFADGMEAGSNKAVSVTGDPTINATDLANKGLLTITSSNTTVATTNKLMIYAVGAGTTTITASLFGKTDSFELTVSAKQTNKDKFGTTHEGDAADPFDNEDAIKVTKALAQAGETGDDYYVKGEVTSFYHLPGSRTDGAVSFYIKPAEGKTERFEIYKCYKEGAGEDSYLTEDDIWVGGVVTAHGHFTTYGDQCETSSAIFVKCEGTKPEPRQTITTDVASALELGAALVDGADSYDYYQFTGYVSAKDGGNYFVTASKGEALVEATSDAEHGSKKYYSNAIEIYNVTDAAVSEKLTKNAKITVTMILKNYHGQVENALALKAEDITVVEAGEPWVISYQEVTFAEALTTVKALADGATSEAYYKFSGVVTEIKYPWSDANKNMSFNMKAKGDESATPEVIYTFKISAEDLTLPAKVVVGAEVTVGGKLQNYVNNDTHTYELVSGLILAVEGEEPEPAEWTKLDAQPVVGEKYVLILDRENNASNPGLWFLKDQTEAEAKESGKAYYINTSNNSDDAAAVEVVAAEGGFKVKIGARYISIALSGTFVNAGLVESADNATVLTYDLTFGFVVTINEKAWGLGTRNDKGYTTVGAVDFTSFPANYKSCLYVEGEGGEGGGGEEGDYKTAAIAKGTGKSYDDATVNGKPAIKCGTSSASGTALITVGQGATELRFYACAWKGSSDAAVTLSYGETTLDPISILADNGLSNNSPFTLVGSESSFELVVTLSGITAETVITVSCNVNRFAIWGAQYK